MKTANILLVSILFTAVVYMVYIEYKKKVTQQLQNEPGFTGPVLPADYA